MRSLLDALQTPGPVNLRRLARGSHSVAKQASFYIAFWTNFGGFSRPKRKPKSTFGELFFDALFERNFGIDFWSFWRGWNLDELFKTIGFSMVFANFHKIDAFKKSANKCSNWGPFSKPKTEKIRWKMFSKACNFSILILVHFLVDFGSIWGSKNRSKIANFRKIWGSKAFSEAL